MGLENSTRPCCSFWKLVAAGDGQVGSGRDSMQARVLTLRYSTASGGFDDCELQRLATAHDLLDLREHVVSVAGEPCLVVVATWARAEGRT
jgi:hypothetical protein